MSTRNESSKTFNYSFETPVEGHDDPEQTAPRKNTVRRVSFGDISKDFPPLSPHEISAPPDTLSKGGGKVIEADSPYTENSLTPEKIAQYLAKDRQRPSLDHRIKGNMTSFDFKSIALVLCGFLPLHLLAKSLSTWNKGNSSIPRLLDSLIERRKEVIDIVVEVTENSGVHAQDLFTKAKQLLHSQESDTHSSVISCLMIYIWASHRASKKRDLTILLL